MNIDTRVCPGCDCLLEGLESEAYPGHCIFCAEEVVAFRPNADVPEEWHFVTNDEDLPEPVELSPAQCGMCGGSFYKAEHRGDLGVVVTCINGSYADGDHEGCGVSRTTRLMPAYQVIF